MGQKHTHQHTTAIFIFSEMRAQKARKRARTSAQLLRRILRLSLRAFIVSLKRGANKAVQTNKSVQIDCAPSASPIVPRYLVSHRTHNPHFTLKMCCVRSTCMRPDCVRVFYTSGGRAWLVTVIQHRNKK